MRATYAQPDTTTTIAPHNIVRGKEENEGRGKGEGWPADKKRNIGYATTRKNNNKNSDPMQ